MPQTQIYGVPSSIPGIWNLGAPAVFPLPSLRVLDEASDPSPVLPGLSVPH